MKAVSKLLAAGLLLATASGAHAFSLSSLTGHGQNADARGENGQPVLMAQSSDDSVETGQLSEQVRKLTGKVEDLNYQLLQMQEQMRQMQKDYEFRFQQLEGGSASGGQPQQSGDAGKSATGGQKRKQGGDQASANDASDGAAPSSLGTMTVDENGNPVGGSVSDPGANASGPDDSASPKAIYDQAYNQVLDGQYEAAEKGFRDYLDIYPDGPQAGDATYWLGESAFAQGQFEDAARSFLDAHKKYPDSKKAPEALLKLGMSLAALKNTDTACATFREVGKRYPNAPGSVTKKVKSEEKRAGC
ncbi:tol-pal system protein YbgF [Pararhizobium mangrovi]|nr:tol-pal system protein YbgF [Pararhizobium mangrovi]